MACHLDWQIGYVCAWPRRPAARRRATPRAIASNRDLPGFLPGLSWTRDVTRSRTHRTPASQATTY